MSLSSPASKIQANLQELFKPQSALGDTYIGFQLTQDIKALLPMKPVQESLIVEADKITPLPNMPKSILGMMSSRDRVFCILDIAQLLGMPSSLVFARQYQIVVVDISESMSLEERKLYLGLAVAQIQGINRLNANQIHSDPDAFAPSLAPYIQGYVVEESKSWPILEIDSLVRALNPR